MASCEYGLVELVEARNAARKLVAFINSLTNAKTLPQEALLFHLGQTQIEVSIPSPDRLTICRYGGAAISSSFTNIETEQGRRWKPTNDQSTSQSLVDILTTMYS